MGLYEKVMRNLKEGYAYGPAMPLRHVSAFLKQKHYSLNIKGAGTVRIRPKSSDIWTFVQVFHRKEYDFSRLKQFPQILAAYQKILAAGQTPVIIDAGANVGAAAIWFAKQFPAASIIAIEPDKDNAELCRTNTRALPNVQVVEGAIGSDPGQVDLINPSQQAWSVQTERNVDGAVAILTIPQLLLKAGDRAKLFIVKIDIEGFEDDLFAKNTEWVNDANIIIVEPHDWKFPGKGTSRNLQKVMAAHNFDMLISGENLFYIRPAEKSSKG